MKESKISFSVEWKAGGPRVKSFLLLALILKFDSIHANAKENEGRR